MNLRGLPISGRLSMHVKLYWTNSTSATVSKPTIKLQYTSPDPLSPCVASEPMPVSTSPSLPWQLQCTYNYRKEHTLGRPDQTASRECSCTGKQTACEHLNYLIHACRCCEFGFIRNRVVGRMQIASTIVYEDVQHEIFNYMNNLYEFNGDVYHT